jgi:hypothetical protein
MEVLLQIAEILTKQPSDHLKLIEASLRSSTKMSMLYRGITEGSVKSDQDARNYLYGSHRATSKYYEVKRRLKFRLIEFLLIYNNHNSKTRNIQDIYNSCLRTWLASRILANEQAKHASCKLLEAVVPVSIKFEFTDITILAAHLLLGYYAVYNPNPAKYAYYSNLIKLNHDILAAETAAEIALFDIIILFADCQKTISEKYILQIKEKHDRILSTFEGVNSTRFLRMFHQYQMVCAEIMGQNELAYDIGTKALEIIVKKPYHSPGSQFSIDTRRLANLIKLGRYEEGEVLAIKQMDIWSEHISNWHIIAFYYFILSCHAREYTTAYKTVNVSLQLKSFKGSHGNIKQLWYINHAYAHFFLQCGKVQLTDKERTQVKKFRIYKFLNEVPIYSKDKSGMNISILIIQILFFVWEKKYKKVQSRINSLSRYCKKYLTDKDTYRSHCFIKMLLQLARADFNPIRGQRYAQKYHDKLLAEPLSKSRQAIEVEIVPYEHLWEMILEMCERNGNGFKLGFSSGG